MRIHRIASHPGSDRGMGISGGINMKKALIACLAVFAAVLVMPVFSSATQPPADSADAQTQSATPGTASSKKKLALKRKRAAKRKAKHQATAATSDSAAPAAAPASK